MRKYQPEIPEITKRAAGYIAASLFSMLVGLISFIQLERTKTGVVESQLVYERAVINKSPVLVQPKGKGSQDYYEFTLMNHKRDFRISGFAFRCVERKKFLDEVNFPDTVVIGMYADDYEEIDEETWTANYNSVITLSCRGVEYIGLECQHEKKRENQYSGLIMGIAGTFLFAAAAFTKKDPSIGILTIPVTLIVLILIFIIAFVIA